jgi:hypothetical protein
MIFNLTAKQDEIQDNSYFIYIRSCRMQLQQADFPAKPPDNNGYGGTTGRNSDGNRLHLYRPPFRSADLRFRYGGACKYGFPLLRNGEKVLKALFLREQTVRAGTVDRGNNRTETGYNRLFHAARS